MPHQHNSTKPFLSPDELEEKREMNKIGLGHFFLDLDNRLDHAANKVVQELQQLGGKAVISAQNLERIKVEEPERWADLQEDASRSDIDLDRQVTGCRLL